MPDWTTHVIAGWLIGKTWKKKVSLLAIGTLLPDLIKIQLIFDYLKINTHNFFDALHTPFATIFVAIALSNLFPDVKEAFILLYVGAISHYILDFFLEHPYGGIRLLFPFSWNEYQIHIIPITNYWMTIIAIVVAILFILLNKK